MAKNKHSSVNSFYGAGITTTVSITLVLLLLGLTSLIGFMGKRISTFVKENLTVTVDLPDTMNEKDILNLQKQLQATPFVKEISYISKEDIKQQLIQDLGRDPEEILGYNPASSCFEINMKAEYANTDSMKVIEKALKGKNIFSDVIYSQEDLDIVNSNLSKIATTLVVFALILIFISFTLIRNTIRLNIYSKRFLINTMQLVGATDSFIRRPFTTQTIFCGIIAAILANMLITAILYAFTKEYPELISLIKLDDLLFIYAIVLVLGIILTYLAARFAVNKYLKMKTNNLYYI